jgi:hypothetical protein
MTVPVTLEITVAPVDLPLAKHTLPHQLRQFGGQVAEIQFTLDLHKSRGRYGAAAEERRPQLEALLEELCQENPHARVEVVDYDPEANRAVGARFFGGRKVPAKHHYGGPIYSYYYGWHRARHDVVFHVDCDLLFGGGSPDWVEEAVRLLRMREDAIIVSPFPGPPPAGGLSEEALRRHRGNHARSPWQLEADPPAYAFPAASTRLGLFDRVELVQRLGPLPLERPRARSFARALLEGHQPYELPERTLTKLMERRGLWRVDLLGSGAGMWSLHPALRSDEFYAALPELIRRVESGDIPDGQRGDYDLNDSMIDWTSARRAQREQTWSRRLARRWLRRAG